MTDLESFIAAINADPANMELRAVFADWLEERGDETAAGWRWLNSEGKVPDESVAGTEWDWLLPGNTDENAVLTWQVLGVHTSPFTALSAAAQAVIESGILDEAASIDKTAQNAHSA